MSATLPLTAGLLSLSLAAAVAAPLTPPNEEDAERTEATCKLSMQEKHLTGKAADVGLEQCISQISPSLGYWEKCRQAAQKHHFTGLELRDDVAACMSREP